MRGQPEGVHEDGKLIGWIRARLDAAGQETGWEFTTPDPNGNPGGWQWGPETDTSGKAKLALKDYARKYRRP